VRIFDDFTAPGFWQNPFPAFERSFEKGDRLLSSPEGGIAVLGYDALHDIGMHPAIDGTPMEAGADGEFSYGEEILRHGLFTQIAPGHRVYRKAVLNGLINDAVKTFTEQARDIALRRVERANERPVDLFIDICLPIATQSWAMFAGYGAADASALGEEVELFSRQLSFNPDPERADDADRAAAALLRRTARVIAQERDCPAYRIANAIGIDRGAPLVASLLFDAIDTAAAGLAGTLAILLHEDIDREALAVRAFREEAIEEALRLATPAPFTVRQARESVTIGELTIPEKSLVWMWWSAGNRDPEAFTEPALFKPGRPKRGVPFGIGAHSCVGHGWTKQLAHILVEIGVADHKRLRSVAPDWRWEIGGARRPHGLKVVLS
jgi:cytochrome P450